MNYRKLNILAFFNLFVVLVYQNGNAQSSNNAAPYCLGAYNNTPCAQSGPSNSSTNFVNDFIDDFSTSGASTNISNLGSGCNAGFLSSGTVNYVNFCQHYLAVAPGQTIVCTMKSGITFAQGFAIWVDWNQDNTFNVPSEYMGGTAGVPAAATNTTITFVIPSTQANGIYRMRVRCVWATIGSNISPCGLGGYGETEDYTVYVGPVPPNSAVPTGTALVNSPICSGAPLNFTLATTYSTALSYSWTGPGSFSSTLQNPSIPSASPSNNGVYTVLITNSICPITRTVSALVVAYPTFTPTANQYTLCQGGNLVGSVTTTNNPSLYTYSWTSVAPGLIFNPQLQNTTIQPGLLPVNVPSAAIVYSVKVTPSLNPACAVTQTLGIHINNPLTPTITQQQPLCNTFTPVQLTAAPGGGTWSANPAVAPNGIFSPTLAAIGTNTVLYSVSAGTCIVSNSGTLHVSRYHTPALTSTIGLRCVQDPLFYLMNIVQDTTTGYWAWTASGIAIPNNLFNAAPLQTGTVSLTHHTFSSPIAGVCNASVNLIVSVFNPPTPTINPIAPKCDTSPTIALSATPPGGVWSGATGVSAAGIRTPSLNVVGNSTVVYTAGQGTCVASSSQTFHLSQFNTAALNGGIPDLCKTGNPVNLMSIVQNTNGSWVNSFPVSNNIFSPGQVQIYNTTTYNVVYQTHSTPIPGLCDDSRTITIKVLNPQTPNISLAGPFCSVGSPIQLTVTPAIGYWVASPHLTSGGLFTPSLSPLGNNPVQYIIGTSTCNASNTSIIKVESFVSAKIVSQISDQCNNNPPVNLLPFTQNSTGNWTGAGIIGSSFNPNNTGSGNFILSYHTASYPSGLCPDQATVAVNVFSLAAPSITKAGPFCNSSAPVQLTVSPAGGLFGNSMPGAVSPGGLFNPALASIGDNFINYTISVGPCKAGAQTKISVERFVSAGLGKNPDSLYCKNHLPFNLNSLVTNPGGFWSSNSPGFVGTNMFDPSLALVNVKNEFFYETRSSSINPFLCPDRKSVSFWVKDITNVKPQSSLPPSNCAPFEVGFHEPSVNSGKGIWNITDGTRYEGLSATHIFSHPGTYTVVFTYIDTEAAGCTTQVVLPNVIEVYEAPKADFSISPGEITLTDPEVTLTNQSSFINNNRYTWTVQGQQGSTNDINAKATFTAPGNYKITLKATNIHECKDEMSKFVEVKNDFKIYIPNSFTPNFDGINDIFVPVFTSYGLDSKAFEMQIFDRWGHQVYQTKDVTKGWDGTMESEVAKEGIYIYKIRYKDLDGRLFNESGHLNLIH